MRAAYQERSQRPICWWEIAALQKPAAQVFGAWFVECIGDAPVSCRQPALELKMHETYEPMEVQVEDWQILMTRDLEMAKRTWGDGGADIAAWFDDGDLWSRPTVASGCITYGETSWNWLRRIPATVGSYLGLL